MFPDGDIFHIFFSAQSQGLFSDLGFRLNEPIVYLHGEHGTQVNQY